MMKDNRSIYVLTSFYPLESNKARKDPDGVIHEYKMGKDGSIEVFSKRVGCFSTVKNAEKAIKKLVKDEEKSNERFGGWNSYACFMLDEVYLDNAFDSHGNMSSFESRRSYLGNGKLCYFSDTDERCEKKFSGGRNVDKYVKDGDYAYVLIGNYLVPALIGNTAFSKKDWNRHFKKGVYGDMTDDSSVAFFTRGYHDHPAWVKTFPVSILEYADIPEKVKEKCEAAKKEYYAEIGKLLSISPIVET